MLVNLEGIPKVHSNSGFPTLFSEAHGPRVLGAIFGGEWRGYGKRREPTTGRQATLPSPQDSLSRFHGRSWDWKRSFMTVVSTQ